MRHVISISLSADEVKELKLRVKQRGFASVSAYFKELFSADEEVISADELLESVRVAEAEYRAGKSIKAGSLAELL